MLESISLFEYILIWNMAKGKRTYINWISKASGRICGHSNVGPTYLREIWGMKQLSRNMYDKNTQKHEECFAKEIKH